MDTYQLYEDDILAWSEQQASALRRLVETPGRLPSELDLEHVAEEIEDVGRSQLDAAESLVRLILVHAVKLAVAPNSPAARHWRSEIVTFQIQLQSKLTASMRRRIDLDQLWRQAKRQAKANLDENDDANSQAPVWSIARCPIDLHAMTDDDFDVDRSVSLLDGSS